MGSGGWLSENLLTSRLRGCLRCRSSTIFTRERLTGAGHPPTLPLVQQKVQQKVQPKVQPNYFTIAQV